MEEASGSGPCHALIASFDHFYLNINRVYMASLMALPMVMVMLCVMRKMYTNGALNTALYAGAGAAFLLIFWLMRTQTPVGNEQFLRSMIPHHSSAIVMCEQGNLTDAAILTLCDQIVKAQRDAIAQMQAILERY